MNKTKNSLFALFFILFILGSILSINENSYYDYKNQIVYYAKDAHTIESSDLSRSVYINRVKSQLESLNFEDVNVSFIGDNLYGVKNSIYIEGTPPVSALDKLINRKASPIIVEYEFINSGY